ncbi:uncharacterized protein RMCB_1152 [Mycolicibacterium brisbanense]|uniref:Uncharacterized protein n=1 Tax=Mycolicibacterium brisbanense TaxID=146020 RepID=A0A100VW96_9MYCO|nr:uncharacterized protein RMCB_1152 [Mycolicibacterium brisbanense]
MIRLPVTATAPTRDRAEFIVRIGPPLNTMVAGAAGIAVSPRFDGADGGEMASGRDLLWAMTQQCRKMEQER